MQELRKLQERIRPYVNEINDEFGEMVNYIYKLLSYIDYIDEEFRKALVIQCSKIADTLEDEYVWVERVETVTVRELVYKEDL